MDKSNTSQFHKPHKILFSGGGTLGPVMPLLAVIDIYKKNYPETQFVWVGTTNGPEREVVESRGVVFYALGGGKWRRYTSLANITDIFKIIRAFFQALALLWHLKPQLLVSCGGYVSVPLHWAGWILGIPAWVHQQDVIPGLANRLMYPFASKITAAVKETAARLGKKAEFIGNPSRDLNWADVAGAKKYFEIPASSPVILALGGGTGSVSVNRIVAEALPNWPKNWHVIHLTGKDRESELAQRTAQVFPNYHPMPFLGEDIKQAYGAADVVVARAGFGTLSELAALSKPAILVPMAGTHQEANARYFSDRGGAVLVREHSDPGVKIARQVKALMEDSPARLALGQRLNELLPQTHQFKITAIIDALLK